ncbi:hypothetical protein FHR80_001147 [Cellulomonas cellasea]|uniref:Uncharacterized protein n=1 Tax=Cellulomonas cellasea TaxID=43670 RepID=A0A7W4UEK1_9CELL|nr:hypothetical protein [Cellulomonas cellasea]
MNGWGWLNLTIASHVGQTPAYGAGGSLRFRLTGTASGAIRSH